MRIGLVVFLITLMSFSFEGFAYSKQIPVNKVKIEFYTKSQHFDKLPVLATAVFMYLRNTHELQNNYVKVGGNDPKLRLNVKVVKYVKDKHAVLQIARGNTGAKKITVFEDRIRYFENLSKHEKKLRRDIKIMFERENFTADEVRNYMLFVLFISEAIDKTI